MTDQEINIAIAEACGWKLEGDSRRQLGYWHLKGKEINRLPDYCHDLNAMHEAEAHITVGQIGLWLSALTNIVQPQCTYHPLDLQWWSVRATARQRAEALLSTKGKRKE